MLGMRLDHLLGEAAERVGHHLHLAVEVAGAGLLRERGDELRRPELLEERVSSLQRSDLDAPRRFAAGDAGDEVVHHVGGEGAGDGGLLRTLCSVVEQRAGGFHLGGGVRQVVGEQLVHIGPAVGGQVANTLADDTAGKVDDVGGSSKIGCGKIGAHGPEVTER